MREAFSFATCVAELFNDLCCHRWKKHVHRDATIPRPRIHSASAVVVTIMFDNDEEDHED